MHPFVRMPTHTHAALDTPTPRPSAVTRRLRCQTHPHLLSTEHRPCRPLGDMNPLPMPFLPNTWTHYPQPGAVAAVTQACSLDWLAQAVGDGLQIVCHAVVQADAARVYLWTHCQLLHVATGGRR